MLLEPPEPAWLRRLPIEKEMRFRAGAWIAREEGKISGILDGEVRVSLMGYDSRECPIIYMPAGSIFGEQCALGGVVRAEVSSFAETQCLIGRIHSSDFINALAEDRTILLDLMKVTAWKTTLILQALEKSFFGSARSQVAAILFALSRRSKTLVMSHDRLAQIAGRSRITIAAQLHYLETVGAIRLERSRITILSPGALADAADTY